MIPILGRSCMVASWALAISKRRYGGNRDGHKTALFPL
jgi:hypothetical protein